MKPPSELAFVSENESIRDEYELTPTISAGSSETARQSEAQRSRSDGSCLTPLSEGIESDGSLEPTRLPNPRWPVGSEQQALLIDHFINVVSHFFDFCDPRRHFGRVVPQKARSNSTLASAVLALSARHLSRTSTFDALVGKSCAL